MAKYYGVERSEEYLAHYGVRGMKWGVRKAIDRISGNFHRSKQYMDAHKKLQRKMMGAQIAGGLAGSAIYAATHKNEFKSNSANRKSAKPQPNMTNRSKISKNFRESREYMNSHKGTQKKLMVSQAVGGLAGSAIYAATHKNEFKSNGTNRKTAKPKSNTVKNSASLKRAALDAGRKADEAYKNLSFLGKHGFGKTARNYRNANSAAREATTAYYNSLNKKQYAKLRRKHIG